MNGTSVIFEPLRLQNLTVKNRILRSSISGLFDNYDGSGTEIRIAWDVRFAYLPAAEAVLDGQSPYPELDDPILEDQKGYVYPPQLLIALLPLTPLPVDAWQGRGHARSARGGDAAPPRRDRPLLRRSVPVDADHEHLLANVSIPLVRCRRRLAVPRRDLAPCGRSRAHVSAKLLFWPLFVWTVVTGRLRATAWAIAIGVGVTLAAWASIGFDGLTGYPDLLRRLSEIQSENSYSFVGVASTLGLPEWTGRRRCSRRRALVVLANLRAAGRRRQSFTAALGATLALSPIVWLHLVVLLVPVAIAPALLAPVAAPDPPLDGRSRGTRRASRPSADDRDGNLLVVLLTRPGRGGRRRRRMSARGNIAASSSRPVRETADRVARVHRLLRVCRR
jgi:hypothetical protein